MPSLFEMLGQTWPARLAKSAYGAVTLPGDVYAGRVDPLSDEGIGRAADLAGITASGTFAGAPRGALGAGPTMPSKTPVKEPWQMSRAEWEQAASKGRVVQGVDDAASLEAVLKGEKPATDLMIGMGHPLSEAYEMGTIGERAAKAGKHLVDDRYGNVIVAQDKATAERMQRALDRVKQGQPSADLGRLYGYSPEDVAHFFQKQGHDYESFLKAAKDEGLIPQIKIGRKNYD